MVKLLDKPLKAFTTYALIVLLCSIPAYFFLMDLIWVNQINERNQIIAEATKKNLSSLHLNEKQIASALNLWNQLQPEAAIRQVSELKPDRTFDVYRKSKYVEEVGYDRVQCLVTYFTINGKNYSLTVESNVEESYETIAAITTLTFIFFIILLLGFIKLNKRISRKLWQPFYKTLDEVKDFDLNNHSVIDFEPSNILEFEELNASINKLLKRNMDTFRQQKEFTENASHELQTPLALVQSKLDLLLQDEAITSSQSRIIEETNKALSRVSRINKNLLLLAKIENQQFLEKQRIKMSEPLQVILDLLSDLLAERKIDYTINSECMVEGNQILVEIMLNNLLINALRYTPADAKIMISLSAKQLVVANAGQHELNPEKVFSRFSTASVQTPGSGLGLSIVQEICKRYGWKARYAFLASMHTFMIDFDRSDEA